MQIHVMYNVHVFSQTCLVYVPLQSFAVSVAAVVVFSYWLVVAAVLYGVLRYRGNLASYTFTELLCIYGYSLSIFVPISVS